jgi:hypothetical protein
VEIPWGDEDDDMVEDAGRSRVAGVRSGLKVVGRRGEVVGRGGEVVPIPSLQRLC